MGSNFELIRTSKTRYKNSSFRTRTKFGPIPTRGLTLFFSRVRDAGRQPGLPSSPVFSFFHRKGGEGDERNKKSTWSLPRRESPPPRRIVLEWRGRRRLVRKDTEGGGGIGGREKEQSQISGTNFYLQLPHSILPGSPPPPPAIPTGPKAPERPLGTEQKGLSSFSFSPPPCTHKTDLAEL